MKMPGWRSLFKRRGEGDEQVGAVLVRNDLMDEHFRRICAVFSDGRCLIAEGYALDGQLSMALTALQRGGVVPADLQRVPVSLEDIAECWEEPEEVDESAEQGISALLRRLIATASDAKASDIVFEIEGEACRVSGIVNDRRLLLGERLTREEGRKLTGYLFHKKEEGTGQTSYQRAEFQGFAIRPGAVKLPPRVTGLRCERGPHEPEGDHLVARIFYKDQLEQGTTLETLGFSAEDCAMFGELRASLSGGIILGGSTGDGKSTTLAVNLTLQQLEHDGQLNMITVEDPVEYEIPGAIQIAVPTTGGGAARGRNFARALMHFVRVHPAVGMVSEIRDGDSAREVLQFVSTGHQVWTTIHVDDANGILFRLIDLGLNPSEVCRPDLVKLLLKQTLLPGLCPGCRLERPRRPLAPWLAEVIRGMGESRYRNPEGCDDCRREGEAASAAWNGYTEQSVVCEHIRPDTGYFNYVRERDAGGARDYWLKEMGGIQIGTRIWMSVAAGECDPRDALRKGARAEQIARALSEIPGVRAVS